MICTNLLGRVVSKTDKFGPFLVRIFGIGVTSAKILCFASGLPYNQLIAYSPSHKIFFLENLVNSNYQREFELKRLVSSNLYFKYANGSFPGLRLHQGLPSRGQRSKTNSRTSKRNKFDFSKIS
jgi:small subunit ribosomal protein S13